MIEYVSLDMAKEVLELPSESCYETMVQDYLIDWGNKHNILVEEDTMGNIYLTKGQLSEDEFYPCMTSHMDTVQPNREFVLENKKLPLKVINMNGQTIIKTDNCYGIGADCKIGIACCLAMMLHFEKCKAVFFVQEENGMQGSSVLDKTFFDNVGYVVGFDSPGLNRASHTCMGVKLFDEKFFKEHVKNICAKYGVTQFNSEPYTDVVQIRLKTNLVCMNFGSGGYKAHTHEEYVVLEHTNNCCNMAVELIEHLGNKQYIFCEQTNPYDFYC